MHALLLPWLLFTLIALVFWGVTGVTQKLATNAISSQLAFLCYAFAMVVISAILALTVAMNWHVRTLFLLLAIGGGTLNGLGTLTSFMALESGGKASVVVALISLYPLLSVMLAVFFLHEKITTLHCTGVAIAVVAAILLSVEPRDSARASDSGLQERSR